MFFRHWEGEATSQSATKALVIASKQRERSNLLKLMRYSCTFGDQYNGRGMNEIITPPAVAHNDVEVFSVSLLVPLSHDCIVWL